jgi:hypothetical protein
MDTVTARDHHALVASSLVKLKGTSQHGQEIDSPLHTVQASGNHYAEVRAFLIKFYSSGGQWQSPADPMHTLPTKDRIGLVTVHGCQYQIADIGMRMLAPRELFRAQGFPDAYRIDIEVDGSRLTKEAQVCHTAQPFAVDFIGEIMSTKDSPPEQLRREAHKIATKLKAAANGEKIAGDPLGKIEASKARGYLDFAIAMDDKILKIQIPWTTINDLALPLLCDFIYDQMREATSAAN